MPAAPATIQTYSLFGESTHLPDVMHCETIASRSALHGWELAPHRHSRLHQILLITSGGGYASLDGRIVPLAPPALVNVPIGHVHAFQFAPGTQGWVVTLADALLDALHVGEASRVLAQSCVLPAGPELQRIMAQIEEEYCGDAQARALMLRGLSASLLGWVLRCMTAPGHGADGLPESNLVQRFRQLIELHFLEHWRVADYARALAVSPTHLRRLTRAATGETCLRLIEARTLREARRHLAYTDLSIAAVAYTLGYGDPAAFTRVFTHDAGMSPRAFRARIAAKTPPPALHPASSPAQQP